MSDKKMDIYIILAHLNQFKAKMKNIETVIEDFDYSTKKIYKDDIAIIENHINNKIKELEKRQNFNNEDIFIVNRLIDNFNEIYKNAYNKKNNESPLSYLMDMEIEEDTNLDLIKKIDIDNLKYDYNYKKHSEIKISSEIKDIDKKSNKKYILLTHLRQSKAKMKDIEAVIEDFDYSAKKIYKDDIARIENHINNEIKEIENDLTNITNKRLTELII